MFALTGTTPTDYSYSSRVASTLRGDGIEIRHGDVLHFIETVQAPAPGAKVTARHVPEGAYSLAAHRTPGGGAFNSAMALRAIVPTAPVRFLETSCGDAGLASRFRNLGIEHRFLRLQPMGRNLVLGANGDKLVVRGPLGERRELGSEKSDADAIEWLFESSSVLASSVKDAATMERLIEGAREVRLHVVLTPSMSRAHVAAALPVAFSICASLDELADVVGINVEQSVAGAAQAIAELRRRNPYASLFVTMGEDGVVASTAGSARLHHVRLRGRAAEETTRIAARRPARICGCGDAFAAGVYAFLEERASLLAGPVYPSWDGSLAAAAGCCSALQWMGFRRRLTAFDFERVDVALPHVLRRAA